MNLLAEQSECSAQTLRGALQMLCRNQRDPLFLNHRRFQRGERTERVGKTPAELLTGCSYSHCLEMLATASSGGSERGGLPSGTHNLAHQGMAKPRTVTFEIDILEPSLVEGMVQNRLHVGVAGVDAQKATPPDPRLSRWGLAGCRQLDPSHPALVTCEDDEVEPCLICRRTSFQGRHRFSQGNGNRV